MVVAGEMSTFSMLTLIGRLLAAEEEKRIRPGRVLGKGHSINR